MPWLARDLTFFLSGVAALVYQVVWGRLLGRVLGSDALGTALVLAVFLGGMALGAPLFARAAASVRRPERLYAALLAAIALWAAISPELLDRVGPVSGLWQRAATAALLLLVPTLAMGATFPFMGRLSVRSGGGAGADTARFYGANTLGAALGALVAAFFLLPALGFTGTLYAAAGIDLAAAALALLALRARERPAEPVRARAPLDRPKLPAHLLGVPLLLGLGSLGLEVVLTRALISVTGASVYAFSLVLAVFLFGLGLGARQANQWLLRWSPDRVLSACAFGALLGALLGVLFLAWRLGEPTLFGALSNRMPKGASPLGLWASHALMAALCLAPAAVAFGAALPAAMAAAMARTGAALAPEFVLSRLYAWNTVGATLGALFAGLVALPQLGPKGAFAAVLAPIGVAALWLPGPRIAVKVGASALALGLLALCIVPKGEGADRGARVLLSTSGPVSNAAVVEFGIGPNAVRSLRVDGKVVATTAPVDRRLQLVLGALPAWLAPEPKRALVVGLGTGMTAGALLPFASLERLDVVELSAAVGRAARAFDPWTFGLFTDPRTRMILGDGRHHMRLVEPGSYDVVTSDPIHPWTRGSSDLYALEHFTAMARALSPGGIASQWLPLYQLSLADVATVVATWNAAFPHTAAWLTAYDLALVGALEPLPQAPWQRPLPSELAAALSELGIAGPEGLAALMVADREQLLRFAGSAAPMGEDRPLLEFRAPRSFLAGYTEEALTWAAHNGFGDDRPPAVQAEAERLRRHLLAFLAELPAGLSAAAERYGARLVGQDP